MRRFCRFSIRDVLWLTLVVAMGSGWYGRESYVAARLSWARDDAREWRRTAEALETVLKQDAWAVERRGPTLYVRPLTDPRFHAVAMSCRHFRGHRFNIDGPE